MGITDLLANNALLKLFRGDRSRDELIVSMVGTKFGERLLIVGSGDGRLVGVLGAKAGLTGHVCAVEPDEARAEQVRRRASNEGVLVDVEVAPLNVIPFAAGMFDVAVLTPTTPDVAAALTDVSRALRSGGRVVVIARSAAETGTARGVELLRQSGFRAARLIAERSGLAFYEAINIG
jgi:ubiquinone/menaquinone biosynthesis C-methylase UbiE